MMRYFTILIAALLLGDTIESIAQSKGEISGRIIDAESGEEIIEA